MLKLKLDLAAKLVESSSAKSTICQQNSGFSTPFWHFSPLVNVTKTDSLVTHFNDFGNRRAAIYPRFYLALVSFLRLWKSWGVPIFSKIEIRLRRRAAERVKDDDIRAVVFFLSIKYLIQPRCVTKIMPITSMAKIFSTTFLMISEIGYCMKQGKLQHFNLQFIGTEFYTYQEIKFCRMNEPFRFGNWWKTISQPFQNGCKTLF